MTKECKNTKRTSVDLDEDTYDAIERIKDFYNLTTMAQVIRKAVFIADDVVISGAETHRINEEGQKIITKYL